VAQALPGLSEVPSLTLEDGLLTKDTAWLRDGTTCAPVQLIDTPAGRMLSWTVCEVGPATCHWRRRLETSWGTSSSFQCQQAGGRGWGGGVGSSSHTMGDQLVRHDQDAAEWAPVFFLQAKMGTTRHIRRPCTPASAHHGEATSEGRVQVCDASRDVELRRQYRTVGGQIGIHDIVSSEPIDCSLPCPVHADRTLAEQANHWLGTRRFFETAAPRHGIYATEALCHAAPPAPPLPLTEDLCQPPDDPSPD